MESSFEKFLLDITHASHCEKIEVIQNLWSGYGEIARYKLSNSTHQTVVVKCIAPDNSKGHPRGWNTSNSHQRKLKSYEVESRFYENYSHLCTEKCQVPQFIGSFTDENKSWIVLEDLDHHFPVRKTQITITEVKVCLKWLANFHAQFINTEPEGLWHIGTYWHLDTRPDEFEEMKHAQLKAKAGVIDDHLNNCEYKTLVHGDAKLANFCFSQTGQKVATVDFQYVGGGCGMKDVAYFLGSCLSSQELFLYEDELLSFYFYEFKESAGQTISFEKMEEEWRKMYPVACADFVRFLLGWMPEHQKINDYNLEKLDLVLSKL